MKTEPVRNPNGFLLHRKPSGFACANTKRVIGFILISIPLMVLTIYCINGGSFHELVFATITALIVVYFFSLGVSTVGEE